MFTTEEYADTDLFGRDLPRHNTVKPMPRQCLICDLRTPRAVDADHRLCDHCREDIAGSRALCEVNIERVRATINQAHEAWVSFQTSLPDETADRWTTLVQSRQVAKSKLDRARTGQRRRGDEERYAQNLKTVEAAWAKVQSKIDRTRKDGDNPLAAILLEESRYLATVRQLNADLQRWEMALSDIEAIDEAPLF